jgi:hypothetical protein
MIGFILHAVGALLILMAAFYCYWSSILGFAVLGFFFEKTQHRYKYGVNDDTTLSRTPTGWFGWITKHRLTEAAGWPTGALIACVIWTFIK